MASFLSAKAPTPPRIALWAALLALAGGGACQCGNADPLDTVEVIVRLSDPAVDFGSVPVGGEGNKSLFLYSDGNAQVALDGPITLTDDEGVFAITNEGTFPITAGTFTALDLRFSPRYAAAGEGTRYEGVLHLPVAPPGTPVDVPVVGLAEPADIALAPEVLDFGALEAGQAVTATLTVSNLADTTVAVPLLIEGTGFLFDGSPRVDVELEALGSQELEVTFAPTHGGPFSALVRAETCGAGCGPITALEGTGLAPRINVSPRPIAFGDVPMGTTNTIEVVVVNEGVGNLQIDSVALSDPAGAVQLGNPPELPAHLSGDDALRFFLTYVPTSPDAEFEATLVIDASDALQSRVTIPVTGRTPGAAIRLLPEAANFGLIEPGGSRALEVVAVAIGTVPVSIDELTLSGAAFQFDGPAPLLPIELAPNQSIQLPLIATATPPAVDNGGAEGTLTLVANSADGEAAITEVSHLAFTSGEQGCQPRAVVANVDLGFLRLGEGAAGNLVVENVGTDTCTGGNVSPASGLPFDPGFDWEDQQIDVLAPGQTRTVAVAFTAASQGQSRAFFALTYDEREAPLLLSATATGRFGTLTPQPAGVALGPGVVGCSSERRTITFINDGQTEINILDITSQVESDAFIIDPPPAPFILAPGASFEARVTATQQTDGLFTDAIVVDTFEVGQVQAWLTSEVHPPGTPVTEVFNVPEGDPKVDILFIVDNSGSMYDDQQRLAQNFAAFLGEATSANGVANDFHIAVTSTDVLSEDALAGALVGPPRVLTPTTSNLEDTFANHVALGIEGTGVELGLEAMRLALDRPLSTGTNAGFHRPEAALSVIVISDEDDAGDESYTPPEHQRSVESYVEFLRAVKGGVLTETPLLFNAVVSPFFADRYLEMVDTFGGVSLDIAAPDWGTQLGQIGSATFGITARFRLANPTRIEDVSVTLDGIPTTNFSLAAGGTTIVLTAPPAPGALVEVTYVPDC